jgi:Arc/MetJ-type ribon-helix-helix transcriptional regulator
LKPNDESVVIPGELADKIRKKIKGTEFDSVANYVVYVLREVLTDEPAPPAYTKEDQERIEDRLKSLGYV